MKSLLMFTYTAATTDSLALREEGMALGPLLLKILLLAALLLALAYAGLLLARHMGWLPAAGKTPANGRLSVIESRRITTHTSVHVLRHGEREFLLTESIRNVALHEIGGGDDMDGVDPDREEKE